jgi:putative chitinase
MLNSIKSKTLVTALDSSSLLALSNILSRISLQDFPLKSTEVFEMYAEFLTAHFYSKEEILYISPEIISLLQASQEGSLDRTEDERPNYRLQGQLDNPREGIEVNLIDWSDLDSPISAYFTVGEAVTWDTRRLVNLSPTIQANLVQMAQQLDLLRTEWGSPIGVKSWFRPYLINRQAKGVANSLHLWGKAVDIYPINENVYALEEWLDSRWSGAMGKLAPTGKVHLDLRGGGYGLKSKGSLRWGMPR